LTTTLAFSILSLAELFVTFLKPEWPRCDVCLACPTAPVVQSATAKSAYHTVHLEISHQASYMQLWNAVLVASVGDEVVDTHITVDDNDGKQSGSLESLKALFSTDDRLVVPGTLHRIR